jgi:predicted DsbA family dithiol-disulfide isomerase
VQAALAKALSEAYFVEGRNVADHMELTGLAERFGLDGGRVKSFLASEEGVAEVREQLAAARQKDITSVPTFVFENGELLSGASGTEVILDAVRRAGG